MIHFPTVFRSTFVVLIFTNIDRFLRQQLEQWLDMPMNPDVVFFRQHPRRQVHIREPQAWEFAKEWLELGDHSAPRRRVLVWNCKSPRLPDGIMRIPFLMFADESIEDDDRTVMPILHQLMASEIGKRSAFPNIEEQT